MFACLFVCMFACLFVSRNTETLTYNNSQSHNMLPHEKNVILFVDMKDDESEGRVVLT